VPRVPAGPGYWPALDGLRAIAVLAVFLLHNGRWITVHNGGYGVEMFFVISGFLITTLLLREHARRGRVRLVRFWSRRLARLYPALVVMVATSATYAALSHRTDLPGQHRLDTAPNIFRSVAPAVLYLTNLFLPQHHYLGGHVHTWSLAVEEQFYLVLPILLVIVLRRRHAQRILLVGVTALAVGAQVWRLCLYRYAYVDHVVSSSKWWYPKYVRVLVETDRADTLLWGVLLALVLWYLPSRQRLIGAIDALAPFGFVYVMWVVTIGPRRVFGSVYYPNLVFGAAAAIVVGGVVLQPERRLARTLGLSPLVWMGRLSYSFYLWHFLIIRAFINDHQFGLGPAGVTALRLVVCLAAAWISYTVIEQPFRTWFNTRHAEAPPWPAPAPSSRIPADERVGTGLLS